MIGKNSPIRQEYIIPIGTIFRFHDSSMRILGGLHEP